MKELYDLIIIGSGSAGMTAGIYAGRAKLKTLIIERDKPGGQIKITSDVENYPGILNISGEELSQTMRNQAENFGVEFVQAVVESVDFSKDIKKVKTIDGEYEALAVIVATGAVPRKLGFVGEDEFRGRGIGYCATCDGEFFAGMDVFVIGAGFAAAEEAIFLTRYARKVIVIAREPEFTCSKAIAERVLAHPKIEVKFNTEILEVGGDKVLKYARFVNNKTGEQWRYDVSGDDLTFGVFVFVGYIPQSSEYADQLRLDERGYIPTDENMQTNIDGVYAAGDIRPKELRQLVTAVADGAIAATSAEKYIAQKKAALGLSDEKEQGGQSFEKFFDEELEQQLIPILDRFEKPVKILAILDDTNELSHEVKGFLSEFAALSKKVSVEFLQKGETPEKEAKIGAAMFPTFAIFNSEGEYTGVKYQGIPGGHEINSFILALYNVAGPGQSISGETLEKIASIKEKVNIKVGISLSCTLCPDVVMLTQLMAIKNPLVEAEMIDVARYPEFKNKYSIMSVPAIVVNDENVSFGKKNLDEILKLINA
ncbi:MAG: FAD-dependent oxidoreductase [Eubacteriales bacterium]|jgi:thioredoxin reductase (NADPH)|nr:FAD-dependent oxidoreductase [Eubacteriales bacterium]